MLEPVKRGDPETCRETWYDNVTFFETRFFVSTWVSSKTLTLENGVGYGKKHYWECPWFPGALKPYRTAFVWRFKCFEVFKRQGFPARKLKHIGIVQLPLLLENNVLGNTLKTQFYTCAKSLCADNALLLTRIGFTRYCMHDLRQPTLEDF